MNRELYNSIQAIINSNEYDLKKIVDNDERFQYFIDLLKTEYPEAGCNTIIADVQDFSKTATFPHRWEVWHIIIPKLETMLKNRTNSGDTMIDAIFNRVYNQLKGEQQ